MGDLRSSPSQPWAKTNHEAQLRLKPLFLIKERGEKLDWKSPGNINRLFNCCYLDNGEGIWRCHTVCNRKLQSRREESVWIRGLLIALKLGLGALMEEPWFSTLIFISSLINQKWRRERENSLPRGWAYRPRKRIGIDSRTHFWYNCSTKKSLAFRANSLAFAQNSVAEKGLRTPFSKGNKEAWSVFVFVLKS